MGMDKFLLPFGEDTILERVVNTLFRVLPSVVIVGEIPQAIAERMRVRFGAKLVFRLDEEKNKGPLEGIRVGLKTLHDQDLEFGFVTACDVPMLNPEVIANLRDAVGETQASIPATSKRIYGISSIYRTRVHLVAARLIREESLRVSAIAGEIEHQRVSLDVLRQLDPQLDSLANLNSPEDYFSALAKAGLECPPDVRQRLLKNKRN